MIILYTFIHEEKHQELLDRYLDGFTEGFKKDILKYKRWQDAQLSLLGRVLLKYGTEKFYNIHRLDIDFLPDKKPFLKGNPVYFNISHSGNLVVCALADFSVGIDIEFSDEKVNYHDFQFQMTSGEFLKIHHSEDKTKAFFTYWTNKEAVIKAHGSGMMLPLDSFEVINDECSIEGGKFFIKELDIDPDYYCCIASENENVKNEAVIVEFFEI
ncbi:4'-phosphopantetheinyl transferase superfamily protein [Chryseobacterium sp.]|uniref:4'-phosphopantetheinyl transferase family protein n=1 Tax=Chryseobacterium sp. TaxID=1871047 RepID=UPI0025BA3551|nr:4'-phosphopantetheinyl transferase superfamily protein [Chryseobacterium sp.]MBV8327071.1 4'-phosphopantetheinyl transferase superfamily protein [Chryseobacterium sp.]